MGGNLLFDGWSSIWRVAALAAICYGLLVLILRTSGKRTIAKLNAYDLVVTVALGSILASTITSSSVSVADAAVAFLVLCGLQFCGTWLSAHVLPIRRVLTGEPTIVLYKGRLLKEAMLRQRLTEAEIEAAARMAGYGNLAEVGAVVFETDGTLSVIDPPAAGGSGAGNGLSGLAAPWE